MTTEQKLDRIKAKCEEIIRLGKERTQRKWSTNENGCLVIGTEKTVYNANARFISALAGPAEAMARSTIAAIDGLKTAKALAWPIAPCAAINNIDDTLSAILSAWPDELL